MVLLFMFWSQLVLAKKGELGCIWLAAHYDKKLTKNEIDSTNLAKAVTQIKDPVAPMALRMSGHLLLGVVRIYARKVQYLMADCQEALVKIKMVFRPDQQTITVEGAGVAPLSSITLPETFGDYDLQLPDIELTLPDELDAALTGASGINILTIRERRQTIELPSTTASSATPSDPTSIDSNSERSNETWRAFIQDHSVEQPRGAEDTPGGGDVRWEEGGDFPVEDPTSTTGANIDVENQGASTMYEAEPAVDVTGGAGMEVTDNDITTGPATTTVGDITDAGTTAAGTTTTAGTGAATQEPAVATIQGLAGAEKRVAQKRKRPVRMDMSLVIPSKVIRRQLEDSSPLLRLRRPAPKDRSQLKRKFAEYRGGSISVLNTLGDLGTVFNASKTIRSVFDDVMDIQIDRSNLETPDPATTVDAATLQRTLGASVNLDEELRRGDDTNRNEDVTDATDYTVGGGDYNDASTMIGGDAGIEYGGEQTGVGAEVEGEVVRTPEEAEMPVVLISPQTHQMLSVLKREFNMKGGGEEGQLVFNDVLKGKIKVVVARAFFELLVLKSGNFVDLEQESAYGDIRIKKTANFDRRLQEASSTEQLAGVSVSVSDPRMTSRID
eukprot:TRINITY_DN1286_c0_g2_i1.p1 TRINITY_DN1286_c0_g2~~TRINITY_DN1286_c0_g2_i1.p1  ORF type:complete len:612 (-),score=207.32 TRINITY_DN1286_c0_g2_i1:25-1860(-)